MKLHHMLVTSIAATALFTGASSYNAAQANVVEKKVEAPQSLEIEKEEYETYAKLFNLAKRNADLKDPYAIVYYRDGLPMHIDLTKLPEESKNEQKITKTIEKIVYYSPTNERRVVKSDELDEPFIRTWGDLYKDLEFLYEKGKKILVKNDQGDVVEVTVGVRVRDNNERIGSYAFIPPTSK